VAHCVWERPLDFWTIGRIGRFERMGATEVNVNSNRRDWWCIDAMD